MHMTNFYTLRFSYVLYAYNNTLNNLNTQSHSPAFLTVAAYVTIVFNIMVFLVIAIITMFKFLK